jgi:sugar-specific transcriptional regulator TrmB
LNAELKEIIEERSNQLKGRIEALENRVDRLEEDEDEEPFDLRSISRDQARKEVLEYYQEHKELSLLPVDVADGLNIDDVLVFEITQELIQEGLLKKE